MRSLRQIKDVINNMAKEKGINAQILLRNYMMERVLERIALSEYKENFILKGGMLVSALVGVESRMTVGMDTTIKRKAINMASVGQVLEVIMSMDIDDGVILTLKCMDEIRGEAECFGFRAAIEAKLDTARIPLKIDITTGDKITPEEELRQYELLIENRTIEIYSYNIETVLAEKIETIISRSIANTRMRDFYDVFILQKVHKEKTNHDIFSDALKATAINRGTDKLLNKGKEIIDEVIDDEIMKTHWGRYQNKYGYAKEVKWDMVKEAIYEVWFMYDKKERFVNMRRFR